MEAPPAPVVKHPVMYHRWDHITFLHWAYPPSVVQPLLPPGLSVDTINGETWVGLTPFLMQGVRIPAVPALPWLSRFPETNLRTYVTGPDGQSAIWFLSLDAARLAPVLAARATYRLPYFWADMSVQVENDVVRYESRRHWPHRARRCHATARVGGLIPTTELDELDHFLTARHVLYTVVAGRLAFAHAEHPPWPLARATLEELDEDLLAAAGLPPPAHRAVVHHSPGVLVRISRWRVAGP